MFEKQEPNKDAKKIYIFSEGEVREIDYFNYFKNLSSNIDIIPISNFEGQSDPIKLKENAEILFFGESPQYQLSEEYQDEVWFVFDTDRWNEGDKIEQLKDFCKSKNDNYTGWFTAQSKPCFELWLYYHFLNVRPVESEVHRFSSFKEYVNNCIKGGFDNRKMPVLIESAINNSLINFETENSQPKLYSTELHKLGKVILHFVKEQLLKSIAMNKLE